MNQTLALSGDNIIAGARRPGSGGLVQGMNPVTGEALPPEYRAASTEQVYEAVGQATNAFRADSRRPDEDRARLLEAIAGAIDALGDTLVHRVTAETGLPEGRVTGERGRTTAQLRLFAGVVREGSWVDARIDSALPDRTPLPKPDIRSMLVPIGPVAVFGASNFPLAFSVAGGDTASALAAGCPVVYKAHPAHPGTSELVAGAIAHAIQTVGFHPGTFSLLHGAGPEVGMALVQAPGIKAVGFTGSLAAGRALFDAAAARPEPVPVFAEMGSVNPMFLLPGALAERARSIARGLAGSVTMGSGQFCTNPGLVFAIDGMDLKAFQDELATAISETREQVMLHNGIAGGYNKAADRVAAAKGVQTLASGKGNGATGSARTLAKAFVTDAAAFVADPELHHEVFGPATIIVRCGSLKEMQETAAVLKGNLTGTIHGSPKDLESAADLIATIEERVGRLIVNGFPTGVEVCPSMHHGGPYPATTDARWTSVGTAAVKRFVRPVCYQDFPQELLPVALRNENEAGRVRLVNGVYTRDGL